MDILNKKLWNTFTVTHSSKIKYALGTHYSGILKANPDIVQNIDQSTNLMPFMIAAVGENSRLDSVFSLLIAYPGAVNA